ncbi:MAG: hypothetical protein ACYTJ0_02225 [Planctomycetota bacterium]|jgi:hypothetical protein
MPDLVIRLQKKRDGSAALACERPDGTVTWQRHRGATSRFFALHDLTHYAVETALGCRRGFFGLLAEGWGAQDFGPPWPRGPLPPEAARVELLVGLLDMERAGGIPWTTPEFNAHANEYCATKGVQGNVDLSEQQLDRIRTARDELFARWGEVDPGEHLELHFVRGTVAI